MQGIGARRYAQRKVEGRAAFGASLANAMLDNALSDDAYLIGAPEFSRHVPRQ